MANTDRTPEEKIADSVNALYESLRHDHSFNEDAAWDIVKIATPQFTAHYMKGC
jgi:hypothetical protein